jgi:hypothetical protein
LCLFVLELDWEKSRRRSEREKVKIIDRTLDRTLDRTRRSSTTASDSKHHLCVQSREGGSRGPLTGRWTRRDAARPLRPVPDITYASGRAKMVLGWTSDRTLSVSGHLSMDASDRSWTLLDSDRTPLQRVRSVEEHVRSAFEKRI